MFHNKPSYIIPRRFLPNNVKITGENNRGKNETPDEICHINRDYT